MQGATAPRLHLRMSEDEISQKRLIALVQSLKWAYGVIWKLSSPDGVLEWVHGWFNPMSTGPAQTLMSQFYSIFKTCSFKGSCAQGCSALALQRGSPFWWTSKMAKIPTDKYKAQFLQEACIQTVVCIPWLGAGGMYCTELATTDLVPETGALMSSLQDYVSTLVISHMFGVTESPSPSSLGSLSSVGQGDLNSDQFSSLGVTHPLNSGTPSAEMMAPSSSGAEFVLPLNLNRYAPGDFNECLGSSGTILQEEEPYFPWTAPGNQSLPSGLFDTLDIGINVEKTMFDSLETKNATKSSSSLDVMSPCKWDSDSLHSKEVELQAMAVSEFTASSLEHSSCRNSVSLPASNAEDLLVLLAGNKPCNPSTSKSSSTVSLETDTQFPSFSHLLEASRSYGSPAAPLKTADQATSSINPFYLQQSTTDMSFVKDLAGWPNNVTNLRMDVHGGKLALPVSHFQHSHESLFKRRPCSNLSVQVGDGHSPRQSLFWQWTEKIVPMMKEDAQQLADTEMTRSHGTLSSGEGGRMPNPAHDEAAHIHKLAERSRRCNFNEKLHTLCTLVPIIKKKDRVSVLSHTIDYIHQLQTQVAQLEEVAGPVLKQGKGNDHSQQPSAATVSIQAQEDSSLDASSSLGSVTKVAVCPNEDGLLINVETSDQTETLIRILTASKDLGLEVQSVQSTCMNNGVHVAVSAVARGVHEMMSSTNVQEVLQRVLIGPSNRSLSTVSSDIDHFGDG